MNQDPIDHDCEHDREPDELGAGAAAPVGGDASAGGDATGAFDSPTPGRRGRRPQPTPVQRALGLLVRREHSRKELGRKLAARGVEAGEAEAAIERLAGEGWQDDTRFAQFLVRSRAATGYGPIYIRAATRFDPDE